MRRPTIRKRHQKSWELSGGSRKADDIYLQRVQKLDEQPMKSMKQTNRFTPLEDSLDEEKMTLQDDALRLAHDAKEMSSHLQQTTRLQTDDNPPIRLSSKKHAQQISSNWQNRNKKNNNEFRVLSPTLLLNNEDKMLFVPLQFNTYEIHGLLDIGAVQSTLSEA